MILSNIGFLWIFSVLVYVASIVWPTRYNNRLNIISPEFSLPRWDLRNKRKLNGKMGPRLENQKGLKELVGTPGHRAQSQLISPGIICIVEVNLLERLFF